MRKLTDLASGDTWPAPGWHRCECVGAEDVAPANGTPRIDVTWATADGEQFRDRLYLTAKTIKRLATFVSRLCPDGCDTVPDTDEEAVDLLARHILANARGLHADVEVVDRPDREGKLRRQVSFAGYRSVAAEPAEPAAAEPDGTGEPEPGAAAAGEADDDLPF